MTDYNDFVRLLREHAQGAPVRFGVLLDRAADVIEEQAAALKTAGKDEVSC